MSPTKTSERTIIRIKDLTDQAPSRFVLLPGGLDRVIIGCEFYEVLDGVMTVYGPNGRAGSPLFSAPVASGYVLIDRALCEMETVEKSLRRMASDEQEAERLHEELYGHDKGKKKATESGNLRFLRPPDDPDYDPTAAPGPPTGQYL